MAADQKAGAARGRDAVQGVQQAQLPLAVKPLGQFVNGQKQGLGNERAGQKGALGLPCGHGAHGAVQHQTQAHFKAQGAGFAALGVGRFMVKKGSVAESGANDFPDRNAQIVAKIPVRHVRRD